MQWRGTHSMETMPNVYALMSRLAASDSRVAVPLGVLAACSSAVSEFFRSFAVSDNGLPARARICAGRF